MDVKISVLVICVEGIIYLLLYNLHDCTFNIKHREFNSVLVLRTQMKVEPAKLLKARIFVKLVKVVTFQQKS